MTNLLYETDFYSWSLKQADLLRHEDYAELDRENLIEEIEDMARKDRKEVGQRLTTIMEHMLKLLCEPQSTSVNQWEHTILVQRTDLIDLLDDNASLKAHIADFIQPSYARARLFAASVLRCPLSEFPTICPWTGEELLDIYFLPDFLP